MLSGRHSNRRCCSWIVSGNNLPHNVLLPHMMECQIITDSRGSLKIIELPDLEWLYVPCGPRLPHYCDHGPGVAEEAEGCQVYGGVCPGGAEVLVVSGAQARYQELGDRASGDVGRELPGLPRGFGADEGMVFRWGDEAVAVGHVQADTGVTGRGLGPFQHIEDIDVVRAVEVVCGLEIVVPRGFPGCEDEGVAGAVEAFVTVPQAGASVAEGAPEALQDRIVQ